MSENKRRQLDLMAHALGSTSPEKWYRNYYVSGEECDNYADLCELEKIGDMERVRNPFFFDSRNIVFRVTEQGKNNFR